MIQISELADEDFKVMIRVSKKIKDDINKIMKGRFSVEPWNPSRKRTK